MPKCARTFFAVNTPLTCIEGDEKTPWDVTWNKAHICAPEPCIEPPNIANVPKDPATGLPKACVQSEFDPEDEKYKIADQGKCTPQCYQAGSEEFLPNPMQDLICVGQEFSPPKFSCFKKASAPKDALPDDQGVWLDWIRAKWNAGYPNGCEFKRWEFQFVCSEPDSDMNWTSACEDSLLTRETQLCTFVGLEEGTDYSFRIREVCVDERFNSDWSESGPHTTKQVLPPTVLFKSPMERLAVDPKQVMLAWSVPCKIINELPEPPLLIMWRSGDLCPEAKWELPGHKLTNEGVDFDGVQFFGARVMVARPPRKFLRKGCNFTVEFEARFVRTLQEPPKPSPAVMWGFEFYNKRPELKDFRLIGRDMEVAEFNIKWDFKARFTCTCGPADLPECERTRDQLRAPTRARKCDAFSLDLFQDFNTGDFDAADSVVTFSFDRLYPGTKYALSCEGHKVDVDPDSPTDEDYDVTWIRTMPMDPDPFNFDTKEDDNTAFQNITLSVDVLCGRPEAVTMSDPVSLLSAPSWGAACRSSSTTGAATARAARSWRSETASASRSPGKCTPQARTQR